MLITGTGLRPHAIGQLAISGAEKSWTSEKMPTSQPSCVGVELERMGRGIDRQHRNDDAEANMLMKMVRKMCRSATVLCMA